MGVAPTSKGVRQRKNMLQGVATNLETSGDWGKLWSGGETTHRIGDTKELVGPR